MAIKKEKDEDLDDLDLDIPELEELDLGEFGEIDGESRETSKVGVAKELAKEAGKGFLESVVKESAKKSLPEEYTYNYHEVLDYADFAKDVFDKNISKINKSFYSLGKEVKKILPFKLGFLDRYLERYESDFEKIRTESEEQIREANIKSTISSIFDKQLEIQKAIEGKRESEEEARDKRNLGISKLNLDALYSIDSNVAKQTAFTVDISKEYYKKSLELQYKSYFVQVDMLKTMRDYYKGFSVQLDSVVKNTGLPDIIKYNNLERAGDILKTQVVEGVYKQVFDNSKYISAIKRRINSFITDKVDALTGAIDQLSSTLDMLSSTSMSGSSLSTLLSILSNLGGSVLGEKLAEKISPKIKDKIKDNKYINAGANYLSLLATSPSTFFTEIKSIVERKAEENSDESTPTRFLASKIYGGLNEVLELTKTEKINREIKPASILTHNKPAIFDNKVHRSITEVIPLFLSKIHADTSNLRMMYSAVNSKKLKGFKQAEELVYDYKDRKLTTKEKFRDNIERDLFKSTGIVRKTKSLASTITSLATNNLSRDKKANKAQLDLLKNKGMQNKFANFLQEAAKIEDISFDYDNIIEYMDKDKIESLTDKADKAERMKIYNRLNDIIGDDYKLREYIKIISRANVRSKELDTSFKDTKNLYPINVIIELFRGAAKLVDGNKAVYSLIEDEQANAISRAFSRFIINEGKDISTETILNGTAFKYLTEKEFEELKDKIKILIAQVKKIVNLSNPQQLSGLQFLLGQVNRAIKNNFDVNPDVFKTLYEYSPILVDKGNISVDNLLGSLGKSKENQPLDLSNIKELTKTSSAEYKDLVNQEGIKNFEATFIDNTVYKGKQYANILTNAVASGNGNIFATIRNVASAMKEIGNDIKDNIGKALDKTKQIATDIGKIIDDNTGKLLSDILPKLANNINDLIENLNKTKKQEEDYKNERIKSLEELKNNIDKVAESKQTKADIDKTIARINKIHDKKMKAMDTLIKKFTDIQNEIIKIQAEQNSTGKQINLTDLFSALKGKINNLLEEFNKTLKEYEDAVEEKNPS